MGSFKIEVYPIEVEAVDEMGGGVFRLKTFDEYSATLTVDTLVNQCNLDELFAAIRSGVEKLELNDLTS